MLSDWDDIINEITNEHDFYLFNWKYGNLQDINNSVWISGNNHLNNWYLLNTKDENGNGEIVMNYGIYNKKIFREIGMYCDDYKYYFCDGDMCERAYIFGYKVKTLRDVKVISLLTEKVANHYPDDKIIYDRNISNYKQKVLPKNIKYLI